MQQRRRPINYKKFEDYNAFSVAEEGWRSQANCKNEDTTIFFAPSKSLEARKALSICQKCPVIDQCLYNALLYQYNGIWGGFTEETRSKIVSLYLNNDLSDITLDQISSIRNQFIPSQEDKKRSIPK